MIDALLSRVPLPPHDPADTGSVRWNWLVLTEGSFQAAKRLRDACKASDVTALKAGQCKTRCLTRAKNAREAGGKDAVQPPGPCFGSKGGNGSEVWPLQE